MYRLHSFPWHIKPGKKNIIMEADAVIIIFVFLFSLKFDTRESELFLSQLFCDHKVYV